MSDVESLLASIESLDKQIKIHDLKGQTLQKKLDGLREELQETCPHENVEQESDYFSGSYDECARTFYRLRCKTCDKVLKSWDKAHNWYG